MSNRIEIADYSDAWPAMFAELGAPLRASLGDVALRIDHIGSTAVPGLAAKPVIDIQVSVAELDPVEPFVTPLSRLGYLFRADNPDRTKRYFREPPGSRRTHIHVRRAGSFSEQFALLFRDFLRASAETAAEYEAVKRKYAVTYADNREAYVTAKDPFIWEIIKRAESWAAYTGWQPGPSDA